MGDYQISADSLTKIWVFHHYATPPKMSGLTRPYNFGVELKNYNCETTVFASSFLHFSEKNIIDGKQEFIIDEDDGIPFVFINTPSSKRGKFSRVINMVSFYYHLFGVSKKIVELKGKPDIILASSPHPLTMIAGIQIARRMHIPCIGEVRDLWPEAIFSASLINEASFFGRVLKAGESWIYRKSNALIFTKEGDVDYIKENKWDTQNGGRIDLAKCHYINNGVNNRKFNDAINLIKLDDPDLDSDQFKVVYTGAIRLINNVGSILDTAKIMLEKKDIIFLIYGDGNELPNIRQRVANEGLTNVRVKGFVEKKYVPYVLSKSSVNILNYSQGKYNWTRGNSSNKLFDYMASGKPILSNVQTGYSLIKKYDCGIEIEDSNPIKLAEGILKFYEMDHDEYQRISDNAKRAALDFDYGILAGKLYNAITKVLKEGERKC